METTKDLLARNVDGLNYFDARWRVRYVVTDDLLSLVAAGLRQRGLDGLSNAHSGCACVLADLAPCGGPGLDCVGGVRVNGCDCGEGCDFHVMPRVEEQTPRVGA